MIRDSAQDEADRVRVWASRQAGGEYLGKALDNGTGRAQKAKVPMRAGVLKLDPEPMGAIEHEEGRALRTWEGPSPQRWT